MCATMMVRCGTPSVNLLTCPFCLAQWTATGFAYGLVFAPQATELVAMTLTAVAGADFLQLGYAWAQHKAESPSQ